MLLFLNYWYFYCDNHVILSLILWESSLFCWCFMFFLLLAFLWCWFFTSVIFLWHWSEWSCEVPFNFVSIKYINEIFLYCYPFFFKDHFRIYCCFLLHHSQSIWILLCFESLKSSTKEFHYRGFSCLEMVESLKVFLTNEIQSKSYELRVWGRVNDLTTHHAEGACRMCERECVFMDSCGVLCMNCRGYFEHNRIHRKFLVNAVLFWEPP